MKRTGIFLMFFVAVAVGTAIAQGTGGAQQPQQPQSLVAEVKAIYDPIIGYITKSADQFPEEKYGWQPTPDVRTFGRLIAHIIDDQVSACNALTGATERPIPALEGSTAPTAAGANLKKADLTKMLGQAVDLCNKAFAAVTDANMLERNGRRSKIGTLIYNTSHTNEHYGNIVTYMRLQGMVPPSTAGRGGRGAQPPTDGPRPR
ncbi:MAG: DinB family protein [Acidobacteriota bacterium]